MLGPNSTIEVSFEDFGNEAKFRSLIKPNTRIVWLETPTNPTLKVFDIQAIAKVCKEKGIISVVDNTFMSPINQNPILLGADVVTHSLTKYIGGHSDLIGGCICLND